MNIYQKLVEVRKAVKYLKKEANGPQYNYVSSSQVLANVREKMNELGLLLIPKITSHNLLTSTVEGKDKFGNPKLTTTYFTEVDMIFTWVNADNPEETIECPWYGQGVDIAGEKGVGKCVTYSEKYFLLKQFNIPTDKDDPDAFQEKHEDKKPKQAEVRGIARNTRPPEQPLEVTLKDYGRTKPIQPPKVETKGVNWPSFWALVSDLGYTQEQVHKIAGVDSIKDWSHKQTTELFTKLKQMKLGAK